MSSMKEIAIRDYISKIDFKHDDWKLSQLKEEMRKFLGEEPGVDIIYKKDVMVNEFTGESKEFLDRYKEVSNFPIYGNINLAYQFINKVFPDTIQFFGPKFLNWSKNAFDDVEDVFDNPYKFPKKLPVYDPVNNEVIKFDDDNI